MGTLLFFANPRTKDVERRPCPTNTHTYTLYSSSFLGRLSPQISFCDPHPTVFFFFGLFLSSFGYKPASRRKQFNYNFKKIYTDIPLELPKDDQGLLLQGFNDVLSPKRDDGTEEIFFHERKLEKRFAGPEIKMPHMRTSVLQPL